MKISPIFEIAIPDTFTSNYGNILQRTVAAGFLSRALSIFQVEKVYIYRENVKKPNTRVARQLFKILSYAETPQYLRKHIFRKDRDLRYVGLLPPLRTPHHLLKKPIDDIKRGEVREGVVILSSKHYSLVYAGLDTLIHVQERLPKDSRVTVEITRIERNKIEGKVVDRCKLREYWGYSVILLDKGIEDLLKEKRGCLKILTSKWGNNVSLMIEELKKSIKRVNRVLIVFGGPQRGLLEIMSEEKARKLSDFILNMAPYQATETIRMEEAVYISLAILNLVRLLP